MADNPFAKYGKATPSGPVYSDPYKPAEQQRAQNADRRAATSTEMDVRRVDLQQQNNSREQTNSRLENPQKLRTEYEKLPEVQNYRLALEQAHRAMNTDANPQGDLALTYAFAKAMDPGSAVRDGEQQMATNTQPWFQAAVESIKKQFGMSSAGTFTPEARAQLRQQVFRQVASLKVVYDARRADMSDNAFQNGIRPEEVVGRDDTGLYAPSFRSYAEHNGDGQGVISSIIGGDPIKPGGNGNNPLQPEMKAGGPGATQTAVTIPPAMQQEHAQYLAQHWGHLDPRDYSAFRTNLDAKYGLTADPGAYAASVPDLNKYAANGGTPEQIPGIPGPMRNMTGGEQFLNDAVSSPWGTAAATTANGLTLGIPEMLNGQKFDALRQLNPKSALAGDVGGGIAGALSTGGLIAKAAERAAAPKVAELLAKPMIGDMLYGGAYGGTTAAGHGNNVLAGIAEGTAGAFVGNKVGSAIGKAFPKLTGLGGEIRALDETVPTSGDLRALASDLYGQAEARGLTATPDDTLALADGTKAILAKEGRITPKDDLTDVQSKTKEAYRLIDAYAGEPMSPTQFQAVRGVVADGLSSQDAGERRISRLLLNHIDDWADATNPDLASGLADARGVASRYLQGDRIAQLRDLAEPGAAQYSQSGAGNALRTQYRQLDRAITKGGENFAPDVVSAVQDVARGNGTRDALRWVGKMAPTGTLPIASLLTLGGTGVSHFGPGGAIPALGLGAAGLGARKLEAGLTDRAAQVAENVAYGGPEYRMALDQIMGKAADRGGDIGTGLMVGGVDPRLSDLVARALLSPSAQPALQ